MPIHIKRPTVIKAAGNKPKIIEEFVGRVNSRTNAVSIARMKSPTGWAEPGQTPEFDEYTVVLQGMLRVLTKNGSHDVNAGEAIITSKGEWCSTALPGRREPSTLPFAYLRLRLRAFAGMDKSS